MFLKLSKKINIFFLIIFFLAMSFGSVPLPELVQDILQTRQAKNIVDKIYLAKQNSNVVDNFKFGIPKAQAAEDPAELEYMVDVGPVTGDTNANYVYASFFNPSGSGRTAVIKRIAVRANAVSTGNYVNLSVRRTTTASGGTQITAANIPKKNNDSSNPVIEVRHTGVSVSFAGVVNSRILGQAMPGLAGSWYSIRDVTFGPNDEKLVIQPNEGIALYQEAGGTAQQRIRVYIEWEEVASAPTAQNEFLFTYPWVKVAATANYAYNSFFNPAASGKTAIVKRIGFGVNTSDGAAAIYQNISLRRTTSASGGTAITASDIPKKHTGGNASAMDFRTTNPTVSLVGTVDARLGTVTPGTTGYPTGWQEINIQDNDEKIILQPGEGIVLISEATGDANQLARMMLEWQEVSFGSTPSSQGEYIFAYPKITAAVAPAANTSFYTFFNPSGSGKTAVIKRLGIRNNANGTVSNYPTTTWRRLSAASAGVSITASDVPKKHTGTGNTAMEIRYCDTTCATAITATYSGSVDSRLLTVNGPGTAQQVLGQREIVFGDNEKLILQEGEGIGFYIEATGDVNHFNKVFVEWDEESSTPSSQGEYLIDIGPVAGSTANPYYYASFFNPAASGKTAIVKRVSIRIDTIAGALYIPITLRRTTSTSGGTQITAANIPKKHTGTANSVMDIRRTGGTAPSLVGSADSRLTSLQTSGAVGISAAPSISGYKELIFATDERIILQQGEGFALYQEAAGDGDFRVKLLIEWEEIASGSTPSSQGEYLMSSGPVNGSLDANYVYESLFNPSGSNKNYLVKRIEIRANRVGALTAPGYIPVTIRKTTAASGGTQITLADVPKKHSNTGTTTVEIRHTGPLVTLAGVADSRLLGFTVPGAVNQYGDYEIAIIYQDELILAPGEGIALYQEAAAGDANVRFRFNFEWSESTLANQAPTVSNVKLNNQNNIDLIENTTTSTSATADISDSSGCSTITNVTAKIYRSGVTNGKDCTANENNCYSVASCTETSCSGTDAVYTCTINMQFDADPTDANTPWTSEYWQAYVEATDDTSLTGSGYSPADAPDVNSLLALSVTNSINYGSLNPGEKNDPLDKITTVTATGNISLDVILYGTNMCTDYPTCADHTMAVGKQKYALSASTAYSSGTSLLVDSGAEAELNCSKTTDSSNKQTKNIWWGIEIPNPQASGSYTGSNTFIGVKNETPWP